MATTAAPPKKEVASKSKSTKVSTHPPSAVMIAEVMKTLKERKGSSLQAVKKAIADKYAVDTTKMAHFIKKAMNAAIEAGTINIVSGAGLKGRFKLNVPEKVSKERKPAVTKEKKSKASTSKPVAKPRAKQPVAASKAPKAKKTAKLPTSKPKAPKPKISSIKPQAKKAAPKKK